LNEGFDMLEERRKAGYSPVHEQFRRMERSPEEVIYAATDDGPQIPPPESDEFKLTVAKCVLSVDQGVFALLSMALGAESASRACVNRTTTDDRVCGADVAGMIANLGWLTSYLFYAPAFCGFEDIVASWCGGDWAWFFANAGSLTSAALGASVDCMRNNESIPVVPEPPRRLLPAQDPYRLTEDMARRLADLGTRRPENLEEGLGMLQDTHQMLKRLKRHYGLTGNIARRLHEIALKVPGGIPVETARRLASIGSRVAEGGLPATDGGLDLEQIVGRLVHELSTGGLSADDASRRLSAQRSGRPHDIVNCAFTVHSAANLIANEVFNGWSTHKVCSLIRPDSDAELRGLCAAGVIGLVSFGFDGTSIATTLAGTCPKNSSSVVYCIGDVTGMASTLMSYGSWASTITHDCKDAWNPKPSE